MPVGHSALLAWDSRTGVSLPEANTTQAAAQPGQLCWTFMRGAMTLSGSMHASVIHDMLMIAILLLGWVDVRGPVGPALRGLITVRSLRSAQATGFGTPALFSVPVPIGPVVAPGVGASSKK